MTMNIEQFKSVISKNRSIPTTSNFEIFITPRNPKLSNLVTGDFLRFMSYSVDIPGMNFSPDLVLLNGHGRINEIPIRASLNNCEINFYLDGDGKVYKFLYTWMNEIFKFDGSYYNNPRYTAVGNHGFDEMNYSVDYYTDVRIKYKNPDNTSVFVLTLYDAFPMELSGLNLDWNNTNNLSTCKVKLVYRASQNNLFSINNSQRDSTNTIDRNNAFTNSV